MINSDSTKLYISVASHSSYLVPSLTKNKVLKKNKVQKSQSRMLTSILLSVGVLVSVGSLVGCTDSDNVSQANVEANNDDGTINNDTDSPSNSTGSPEVVTATNTPVTTTVQAIVTGEPVIYDVSEWETGNDKRYTIDDLTEMQQVLGEVVSTDENSLDYASNTAIKYRFMEEDAPYFDIIDSKKYLELGWYYANPDDSEEQKQLSIDHAKKAYELAHNLMGEEGGSLIQRMLTSQIIRNEIVNGQYIELAKCEFYSCMLIIKKVEI